MDQWGKEVVQDYDVLTGWQEGLIFLCNKIEKSFKRLKSSSLSRWQQTVRLVC